MSSTIFCRTYNTVNGDLLINQYKIVVALFGAGYAAPNKGKIMFYLFYANFFHYLRLAFEKNFNV